MAFTGGSYICEEATPAELRHLPMVSSKVAEVRAYRAASKRSSTRKMADYPTLVGVDERLNADTWLFPTPVQKDENTFLSAGSVQMSLQIKSCVFSPMPPSRISPCLPRPCIWPGCVR